MLKLGGFVGREKVTRVALTPRNAQGNVDSSDEENEGEMEEPDVDDSEILEDLPDDTEVSISMMWHTVDTGA